MARILAAGMGFEIKSSFNFLDASVGIASAGKALDRTNLQNGQHNRLRLPPVLLDGFGTGQMPPIKTN